jgi:prepilin-type N-terminal cleavage/methylation domain-containing protein
MRKKPNGFTLVELLVVISIIALLLGMLIPGLNMARKYAKKTVCKANLHDIGLAIKMYLDNNRYFMPPGNARKMPYSVDPMSNQQLNPGQTPIVYYLGPYLNMSYNELSQIATRKVYCKVLSCPGDYYSGKPQYYFKSQTSSYEYDPTDRISGKMLDKKAFRSGIKANDLAALSDWDAFHGKKPVGADSTDLTVSQAAKDASVGSYNYLFCDFHIGDRKGY